MKINTALLGSSILVGAFLSGCVNTLHVTDANGQKLPGVPVFVLDSAQEGNVVYLNVKSGPFGKTSLAVELNEEGHLTAVTAGQDTPSGPIEALTDVLTSPAALAAAAAAAAK